MSRPLASVTETVTCTISTRLRNGAVPVCAHTTAPATTMHRAIAPTRVCLTSLPVDARSRLDACVVVLERSDAECLLTHRLNRADRRRRAGQGRDARHLRHRRGPPDGAVVEERLAPERGVDHHVDAAIDE